MRGPVCSRGLSGVAREPTAAPPAAASRTERALLAAVLAIGALLQALALAHDWRANPFAHVPLNDADVYWRWAGEIASGKLVGDEPYFSAPLYPYLVGLLRALGGGLLALSVLQAFAHVATAWIVWRAARASFGIRAALVAAFAWVVLDDAGYGTARVLNGALQALLVAWTWERAVAWRAAPNVRRARLLGLALGLAVLSNPTLLPAVALFTAWIWWSASKDLRTRAAVSVGGIALLAIAPATVHNALACGELIPVSAQAGVTFLHGNAPGADGTYHAIEGVSTDRARQNEDARELVRSETDGSWSATSSAFFRRGLAWWRAEPLDALGLAARKAWWFASGRDYGDIYAPVLEARDGWSIATSTAPLRSAWLVLPALLALALLARDVKRFTPELVLVLAAFATVVVFWYSPRYRLPAMPIVCALAAAALVSPRSLVAIASNAALAPSDGRSRGGRERAAIIGAGLAFLLALASGPWNRWNGFDDVETHRAQYEYLAGRALLESQRIEQALPRLRAAANAGHPDAAAVLGDALRRAGRPLESLEVLRELAERAPSNAFAQRALAVALASAHELAPARAAFERALALDPRDVESLAGLGGVLHESGDDRGALEKLRAAVALRPDLGVAQHNLGVVHEALGELDAAGAAYAAALRADPASSRTTQRLADLSVRRCDFTRALEVLARGLQSDANDLELLTRRAWLLATAPNASDRDGKAALAISETLVARIADDAGAWNIHAAALAECGRFDEAVAAARRAIELLRADGPQEALEEMQPRLELYLAKKPFHQPPC